MSVFIAAMGAISGAGTGVHMAWDAMRSGKSLAERVEAPVRVGSRIVSTAVRAPEDAIALSARERRRLPRAAQLALVAVDDMMGTSVPMTTGSAMILVGTTFRASAEYADHPPGRLPLLAEAYAVPNAIASLVAERVGSSGPSMVVTTACASGIEVLNVAAWAVNSGQVDTVICVAVDVLFATAVVTGFAQIGAIATSESDSPNPLEVCRPFDRHRDGFVLGEAAAAALVTRIPASGALELVASRTRTDWAHPVNPDQDAEVASQLLLHDVDLRGWIDADRLAFVCAHASATRANDSAEATVLDAVGYRGPVFGAKGCFGHTMAASGLLELGSCWQALSEQVVPPTAGLSDLDPDLAPIAVTTTPIALRLDSGPDVALKLGFCDRRPAIRRYGTSRPLTQPPIDDTQHSIPPAI